MLGAASVLQCHGVLVFRNRPLGGHCGAVLRAWELHFGAGFLSVQKATLGTGACLLGADRQTDKQTGRQACHGVLLFRNRPLRLRCGAVLRAWELHCGAGFLLAQKATLGSGACLLGAASVLQCHGVLLFRNRPLGGRCGAVLRAWELHFGAGFLSAQKATLGSGACLLGAASVLQCHGVLLFRNRPLGGRCGAVLRAWELHFGAGFLSVQKATLGSGPCLLGAASVLQCHGVLVFRNRPPGGHCGAVLRAWELHFGAGFLLVQKATLGTGACLLGADRQTDKQTGRQACHGVLLFRNRPLRLRCGAVLRAWELHCGAGFLSAQKATLGSGACLLGAASVLQCHGVLLFRNRPLGGRCGAVLRAWELHFGAGFLSVQKATLGSEPCLLGAASVLQCHGVLLFRNRPLGGRCDAVLRAWELHFGAGFLSVQKATLGTGAGLLGADR